MTSTSFLSDQNVIRNLCPMIRWPVTMPNENRLTNCGLNKFLSNDDRFLQIFPFCQLSSDTSRKGIACSMSIGGLYSRSAHPEAFS